MRELSSIERTQVDGGVLPVLAAIGSFVGHQGVRTVGGYMLSRALTTYSIYGAADYLDQR